MTFDLKNLLKALLISTGDPLDPKEVQKLITRFAEERAAEKKEAGEEETTSGEGAGEAVPTLVPVNQIRETFEQLGRELEAAGDVYRVLEGPQGFRLTTAPVYADWVRLLRNEPRPVKLSPAALETLAIIAYRQPVTRAEMETIRGVAVDSAVNRLLELELVQVTGRAELPGRPIQYGTTERFLDFAGIKSIEELPASDVISHQQLDTWIRQANQQSPVSDADVGLEPEQPEDDTDVRIVEQTTFTEKL